jgi:hypothetical protein
VPGPTITSTTVVTSTVVATATAYTTVTRTETVTVTTVATATETVAATATATATVTTATTKQEDISREKARLTSEVDEFITSLSQLRQRLSSGPVDAVVARALAELDADISKLNQVKNRVLATKTLEELRQLRQEFETIKSKYVAQQQQQVSPELEMVRIQLISKLARARTIVDAWWSKLPYKPPGIRQEYQNRINRINEFLQRALNAKSVDELKRVEQDVDALLSEVERLGVDVKAVSQQMANAFSVFAQEVKDENVKKILQQVADVYSYLAKTDIGTHRRDLALFYMLMDLASSDVYKQVYESRRGSFQALLKVLSGTATYSDVESAYEALALLKQLKDQGLIDEKQVLDHYRFALIADKVVGAGITTPLYPIASLVQTLQALWQAHGGDIDKEVVQRLRELESQVGRGLEPGKKTLSLQLIAEATALINPARHIYSLVYGGVSSVAKALGADDRTASSIASKIASGATGATIGTVSALIPPLGLAIGLAATLNATADIASRLTSPVDKQLLLSYLQNNWQDLLVNTAIGIAAGLATGYTVSKLKPTIYNKIADGLEKLGAKDLANRIRASIGVPTEGGRGVVKATVREVPEEVTIEHSYDPTTGKMTMKITLGGKTEVIDVGIPKGLANEFKAYARSVEHGVGAPEGTVIARGFEAVLKLMYKSTGDREKTLQMFRDFATRVGLGDDVAVQVLRDAVKGDIVGDVMLKVWSQTSTIYDNVKGLCRYIEKGGKAWKVAGASDEASSLIRGLVMYDDEAAMRMLVGKQAYIYPKTGGGTYLNSVILEKYVANEGVYLAIVNDLRKLFNVVKANIELLKQLRERPEGGGLPPERLAQLLKVELSPDTRFLLSSDPAFRTYVEGAIMELLKGTEVLPVLVYDPTTNFMRASILVPASVASIALQSFAERGVVPVNMRVVPIHRQVVETAVVTRTAETVHSFVRTVYTGTAESIPFKESAVRRIVTEPVVITKTAELAHTRTVTKLTVATQQIPFSERAIHRTETIPFVVTRTVETVATAVGVMPTAITSTQHLIERPVHRTDTVPMVITQTNTFIVATTTTIIATVSETGAVSVVTVPMVITYTITVPITIATATPAPAPPTPTETGATGTVVAKPPLLPRLPGLEGVGLAPTVAKPEKKPEVEKEVLVI